MSEQTLKKILITLGVLVALWGVSSLMSGGDDSGASDAAGGVASALDGLDGSTVEAVQIDGPLANLSLVREGGAWTVNGFRADSSAVDRLWEALTDAEVGRVVATNPANHERMGVSADSAWTLSVTRAGGATSTVLIGKSGPTFPSAYARVADDDDVVVVSGDLRAAVARGVVQWRDKTVLQADTAAIARVVVEMEGETLALERPEDVWMVDGEVAAAVAVGNLMSELNRLVASGFVEDGPVAEGDLRRVTAFSGAGDLLLTVEISGTGSTRHARVPDNAVVFEIPVWRVDRFAPSRDTLLPAEDSGG